MALKHSISWKPYFLLMLIAGLLYAFFFAFHVPMDYEVCALCDRHQYIKMYEYFHSGIISQVKFPFFTRPLVPFLVSWIPSNDVTQSFHIFNITFGVLSIFTIWKLWEGLKISWYISIIGVFWLTVHWTGIIRYNLMDYVTVDVPLYLLHALALMLFFKKQYRWFYVLTPLAILIKDSFIPVMIVFIGINLYLNRNENWFASCKHLILALLFGIVIQKVALYLLPEQLDQKSSVMALLHHIKLVFLDPSRLIRWFAAIASAFGVFPVLIVLRWKTIALQKSVPLTLFILSLMFVAFGLTAGEDMTRIIFLGFPFIMTLALMVLKEERLPIIIGAILLSIPFMNIYPFFIDVTWAVDYADMSYVYKWASFHLIAALLLVVIVNISKYRNID